MRYSDDHKQATHDRIVREAGRLFREQGYKGTGVDAVMQAAGLTPGGFYAHFRDKQELLAEALIHCSAEGTQRMLAAAGDADEPLKAWAERYLSEAHRDEPGQGCPLPTLAAEVPRQPKAVRKAFTKAFSAYIATLAKLTPAGSDAEQTDAAIAVLATMVGGMLLARAVEDAELSARILRVARAAASGQSVAGPAAPRRSKSAISKPHVRKL